MTLLALVAGGTRCGIDVRQVLAVVPMPRLTPVARTPPWVAGAFPFFGVLVPVVDLCLLHADRAARQRLGTRVIVVRYAAADGLPRALGLMAEGVTDIVETGDAPLPTGLARRDAPWLTDLAADDAGEFLQLVNPADLLTDEVRSVLFPP